MTVVCMIAEALSTLFKGASCVYLGTDTWQQFLAEEGAFLLEGHDPARMAWYCEGARVMHDPRLKPSETHFLTLPGGVDGPPQDQG